MLQLEVTEHILNFSQKKMPFFIRNIYGTISIIQSRYLFILEWHKTTITSQKSKSVRLINQLSVTSGLAFLTNLAIICHKTDNIYN